MYYTVGTHIDLRQPKAMTHETTETTDEPGLYAIGTRILFVKFVEGVNVLRVNRNTIAYIQ